MLLQISWAFGFLFFGLVSLRGESGRRRRKLELSAFFCIFSSAFLPSVFRNFAKRRKESAWIFVLTLLQIFVVAVFLLLLPSSSSSSRQTDRQTDEKKKLLSLPDELLRSTGYRLQVLRRKKSRKAVKEEHRKEEKNC